MPELPRAACPDLLPAPELVVDDPATLLLGQQHHCQGQGGASPAGDQDCIDLLSSVGRAAESQASSSN